jgi:hypothetical protein
MKSIKAESQWIALVLMLTAQSVCGQDIFVSITGNDSGTGTQEQPLRNLQTAIDKIKNGGTVNLRGGVYYLQEPLQLKPENSGLTIKPYAHENVVLSSGKPIENWELVKHPVPGKNRPGKVWKAKVPKGKSFLTLFDEQGFLPRCASPKFKAFEQDITVIEGGGAGKNETLDKKASPTKLYYRPGQIDHVESFEGAEVFILPRFDWVANYLPIATVNREERLIETSCPGTYDLITPPTWTQIELFYQLENVPEFLDAPGEWFLDAKSGELYLIARNEQKPSGVVAPTLNQIITLQGDFPAGNYVENVTIEGITFSHADRMTWENGRVGVQHDWEVVNGEWACIKAKGVSNLQIKNCLFKNSGGNGIRIDFEGFGNTIANNEFRNLGGSAISLIGYAPGTHDKLHTNKIINNYIHHCAKLWWLQAGITLCQSSNNLIANNLIHHLPYNGMALVGGRSALFGQGRKANSVADGLSYVNWEEIPEEVDEWYEKIGYISTRDNVIEHNEIYQVVQTLGDGNAIYLSGVGTGNILQKNYVHNIPSLSSAGGLRFDNDTWFCTMRNNVVWNVNGCNIVSKWVNNIENNIMVNSGVRSSLSLAAGPKWGSNIRRNIVVNKRSVFEPTMNKWMKLENILFRGELKECLITDNLFYVSDDDDLGKTVVAKLNENLNSEGNIHSAPNFYDLENGDFRLKENSPALKMGFIPFEDYGLTGPVGKIE